MMDWLCCFRGSSIAVLVTKLSRSHLYDFSYGVSLRIMFLYHYLQQCWLTCIPILQQHYRNWHWCAIKNLGLGTLLPVRCLLCYISDIYWTSIMCVKKLCEFFFPSLLILFTYVILILFLILIIYYSFFWFLMKDSTFGNMRQSRRGWLLKQWCLIGNSKLEHFIWPPAPRQSLECNTSPYIVRTHIRKSL